MSPWALILFLPFGCILLLPRCALCILYRTSSCSVSQLLRNDIGNVAAFSGFSAKSSLKFQTTDTAPQLLLIPGSISVSVFPTLHISMWLTVTMQQYEMPVSAIEDMSFQVITELQPMLHDIFLLNKCTVMTSSKSLCAYNCNLSWSVELETRTAGWIRSHFTG